jgi:hypothetical protein
MSKKRKLTKQEQRFHDKWARAHKEFNAECDALVEKSLRGTLGDYAEFKSEALRLLAKRHGVEVEVIDIPMVDDGPIAWPQVQEEE